MKKLNTLLAFILFTMTSGARDKYYGNEQARNSIYIEAFGQGLYGALSFDRLTHLDKPVKRSWNIGLTAYSLPHIMVLALPASYNFIFGKSSHHLELGIGFTPMYYWEGNIYATEYYIDKGGLGNADNYVGYRNNLHTYLTPKIGYRFQQEDGGLFLRFTFTPAVALLSYHGPFKGGPMPDVATIEMFKSIAFIPYPVFPWLGVSVGWTFK